MAFDRKDPADLSALNTEILTDPLAHGYNPDNTRQLLSIINDVLQNKSTPSTVQQSIDDVGVTEVSGIINEGEYSVLSEYDKAWVNAMIVQPGEGQGGFTSLRPYKQKFLEVFPNGTVTNALALQLLEIEGSRAESLFGAGTVIVRDDWIAARELGGATRRRRG